MPHYFSSNLLSMFPAINAFIFSPRVVSSLFCKLAALVRRRTSLFGKHQREECRNTMPKLCQALFMTFVSTLELVSACVWTYMRDWSETYLFIQWPFILHYKRSIWNSVWLCACAGGVGGLVPFVSVWVCASMMLYFPVCQNVHLCKCFLAPSLLCPLFLGSPPPPLHRPGGKDASINSCLHVLAQTLDAR